MLNKINPIYNVNFAHKPNPKIDVEAPITNPIQPNVSFKGLESLAAYNFNLVNKNNNFDIPQIEPLEIPTDITKIGGTPIYSSKGELEGVIKENANEKYIYHNNDYKLIEVFDKETGKKIKDQKNNGGDYLWVKEYNNNEDYWTTYKMTNGDLQLQSKEKTVKRDGKPHKSYMYENQLKEYHMLDYSNPNLTHTSYTNSAVYDGKGNLKEITENSETGRTIKVINYKDNIPYRIEENKVSTIPNKNIINPKDLLTEDLQPHAPINIRQNPAEIDGKKTFYSDGTVETNTFIQDGKKITYHFLINGDLRNITFDNKLVEVDEGYSYSISENFGKNHTKYTTYSLKDNTCSVGIENNNIDKSIRIKDDKVIEYSEFKDKEGFSCNFNIDGSLRTIHQATLHKD